MANSHGVTSGIRDCQTTHSVTESEGQTKGAETEGGEEVRLMKKMIRTALALFAASVVIGPGEYFLRWIC